MELKEELDYLVKIVKKNAKSQGNKITNAEIAAKYGINRTYLSDLLNGTKELQPYHIENFKLKLREELRGLTPERALLDVLIKEFAAYKAEKESLNSKDIINDIKNKAEQLLKGSHKSSKPLP